MAMSWTIHDKFVIGDRQMVLATGTFDASYPTGGEDIAAANFGLSEIDGVYPNVPSIADQAIVGVQWVRSTSKLMVIDAAGLQEGNTTNLAATTVEVLVIGK